MVDPPDTSNLAPSLITTSPNVDNLIVPPLVKASAMVTLEIFSNGTKSIKPLAPLRASTNIFCLNKGPLRKMGLSANSPEKSSGLSWLRDIGAAASTPETSMTALLPT